MGAWQDIEKAEEQFLNTLADLGGLAPEASGMLRHCARLIKQMKTREQVTKPAGNAIDGLLATARPFLAEELLISLGYTWDADSKWVAPGKPNCEAKAGDEERDALAAENKALRDDAERYRWLRRIDSSPIHVFDLTSAETANASIYGEELDAAIDAARASAATGGRNG